MKLYFLCQGMSGEARSDAILVLAESASDCLGAGQDVRLSGQLSAPTAWVPNETFPWVQLLGRWRSDLQQGSLQYWRHRTLVVAVFVL